VQSALSPRANAFEEKGDAVLHPLLLCRQFASLDASSDGGRSRRA
jgi:hypothetical protein